MLRKAVRNSVPLGTRQVSEGGMRFTSKYFRVGKKSFLKPLNSDVRLFAEIWIRGDRRPYTIEISVIKQKLSQSSQVTLESFQIVGTDQKVGQLIKRRIIKQLSKRREDLNIIDDFRVF